MDVKITVDGAADIYCRFTTAKGMSCYTSSMPFTQEMPIGIGDRREEPLTREHIQMIAYGVGSRVRETVTFEYVDGGGGTRTDEDVVLRDDVEITVSKLRE